jgi:hypothetical protein
MNTPVPQELIKKAREMGISEQCICKDCIIRFQTNKKA